jgi:hypothetical protein
LNLRPLGYESAEVCQVSVTFATPVGCRTRPGHARPRLSGLLRRRPVRDQASVGSGSPTAVSALIVAEGVRGGPRHDAEVCGQSADK